MSGSLDSQDFLLIANTFWNTSQAVLYIRLKKTCRFLCYGCTLFTEQEYTAHLQWILQPPMGIPSLQRPCTT